MTRPKTFLPNVMVAAMVPHEVDGVKVVDIDDTKNPLYQKALAEASACFLIHEYRIIAAVCRADFFDSYFDAFSGMTIEDAKPMNPTELLSDLRNAETNFYDDFAVLWDSGSVDNKDIDTALADFYAAMEMINYDASYENLSDEDYIEINPSGFRVLYEGNPVRRNPRLTEDNLNRLTICFPGSLQRVSCPNEEIF